MPTYDYACDACGHAFEEYQAITAAPLKKCPACGKLKLKRLMGTGGGIIFKGSGFYQTDYRSEGYKKAAAAETSGPGTTGKETAGAAGGGAESASDSKGDAKPAAASDSKTTKTDAKGGDGKTEKSASAAAASPSKPSKSPEKKHKSRE